jgi:tRNA A-37 threonylcarbamoyl transferase component Bud32
MIDDAIDDPTDGSTDATPVRLVPEGFLQQPFLGSGFHVAKAMSEAADGEGLPASPRLDRFIVEELVASGSFASVYAARQSHPTPRRVALKVLHVGLDHRSAMRRFLHEQQSLARLEHLGIARLYESGLTEDGRLYFAMEFVAGEPIDVVSRRRALSIPERVRLVRDACRAVHHAHVKGIIHRDLKPSNVLVAEIEGALSAKVIDFGVAKAIEGRVDDSSLQTVAGQLVGTPAYMAPEQLEGRVDEVDVRSDIYAMGALLHELISGRRPHRTGGLTPLAAARLIRMSHLPGLRGAVDGVTQDLDRAIACALAPDPEARYQSMAELAADLDRILEGEPVRNRRLGPLESASRWSRRHPIPTAVAILLVGGLVAAATASWAMARSAARDLRTADRELAMLRGMVREYLDVGMRLADRSGVVAERRHFLEQAAAHSAALLALRPDDADLRRDRAKTLLELSKVMRDAMPSELVGAEALRTEALAILDALVADQGFAEDRRAQAIALILCGDIAKERGDLALAEARYAAALAEHRRLHVDDPDDLASARQVVFGIERLGHLATLREQNDVASAYFDQQLAAATELCATYPERAELRWDRCLAGGNVFSFALERDLSEADQVIDACLLDAEALVAAEPESQNRHALLGRCRLAKARVLRLRGDAGAALAVIRTARTTLAGLAAADPDQTDRQVDLGCALIEEALVLQASGRHDEACEASDRASATWLSLLRDRPDNPSATRGSWSAALLRRTLGQTISPELEAAGPESVESSDAPGRQANDPHFTSISMKE